MVLVFSLQLRGCEVKPTLLQLFSERQRSLLTKAELYGLSYLA